MSKSLIALGIESSCDDTAASLIMVKFKQKKILKTKILSSIVLNQKNLHDKFGGVVPELAARAHAEALDVAVELAIEKANQDLRTLNLICVTSGPGLIGGVMSGVMFSKALSLGLEKPLVGVNHLAGHALTPRLTDSLNFPYLMLLVSGGHCQFLIVKGCTDFQRLGGTLDDAPGEAFDKTAKILKLGYPGGPIIELFAKKGDPARFNLPRPLVNRKDCSLSFSGLKTALRREYELIEKRNESLNEQTLSDLCASFQESVKDILLAKSEVAMKIFQKKYDLSEKFFAVSGGVAANQYIQENLRRLATNLGFSFLAPPSELCTDNAAMIAYAGTELYLSNKINSTNLTPRARWPLDQKAKPMLGSGKKGFKA